MGTFVPLSGPAPRQAAPKRGFVPLQALDVTATDDYKREKASALQERELAPDRSRGARKKGAPYRVSSAGEALAWGPRNLIPFGLGEGLAEGLENDTPLSRVVNKVSNVSGSLTGQAPLPILDEINAGVRAGGNAARNLGIDALSTKTGRGLLDRLGLEPAKKRSTEAVYRGQMDADRELKEEERRRRPVSTFAGTILSGLPAAGETLAVRGAAAAPGATAKLLRYAGNVGKGAGAGAVYGGAYGAADADDSGGLEEGFRSRMEGGGEGALLGGLTGGLLEGAAPAVVAGARGGKKVVTDIVRAARKPSAEAEREAGTRTALEILQRKGLTAEEAERRAAEYAPSLEPTAAELAGQDVERLAGATARRGGTTGETAMAVKLGRQEGAPERVLGYAKDELGVDPVRAQGDLEGQVELGRQIADPLYADVRANKAGIWNDELQELHGRPVIQEALGLVGKSGRNAGRQGTGLGMGTVDVPAKPVGPDDLSFGATGAPDQMPVPRGPAEAPSRGPSALTYLRMTGHGISDSMAGEAAQAGLRLGARKGGAELNDMAIRLNEAGYTPRVLSEKEMEELLDSGMAAKLWAREPEVGAQGRFDARQQAEEFNQRGGNPDDLPHPEDYGNAGPAPERPLTEPARQEAPTGESWDQILSALDQMIERDPLTDKVVRTGSLGFRNRDLETAARDLRAVLLGDDARAGAVPGLREARTASGDYRSIQSAAERVKGKLTKGTYSDLEKVWKSARGDAEKDAMKGAMANEIYELVQGGALKAGRVTTRRAQAKLELLFGKGEGKAFVERIKQEAKAAGAANRMAPTGGSPSFGLTEAGKEADAAMSLGDLGRIAGKFGRGKIGAGLVDAVVTPAAKLYRYSRTAGLSEEARNAMGEVLFMGPEELIPLLKDFERLPPDVQRVVYDRAIALGLVGGGDVARMGAQDE